MGWRGWKWGEAEWLGLRALLPVLLRRDALVPGAEGKQVWGGPTPGNVLKKQLNTGIFGTIPKFLPDSHYQRANN